MKKIVNKLSPKEEYKYLSRCIYYGKLIDWEFVEEAMVLKFSVYTATRYYGSTVTIRIYVPTDMENDLCDKLIVGDEYFVIAAPYKVNMHKNYKYRVDLLLNIFKEI